MSVKSSTLCLLLCLGFVATSAITVVDKSIKYNENKILHSVDIHDSLMTTVVRSFETAESAEPRFVYINITALDGTNETRQCRYELEDGFFFVAAQPVGMRRVLMFSSSSKRSVGQKKVEIAVVNTDDCRDDEEALQFRSLNDAEENFLENLEATLINDDRTFDILYSDDKICGEKLCKLGIDFEGKRVRGPTPSFVPLARAYRYVEKEPSSSTFIVTELNPIEAYRISLVKPDGQVILKEYERWRELKDHDISNADGVIRICSKTNTTKVDCEIFDDNGKSKSIFSVDVPHKVETVTIKNLDDGKFLLLTEDEETGAAVMKVEGNGTVIGVAKLPDFTCDMLLSDYKSYLDVIDNKSCVTRRCLDIENLKVTRECYRDNDFH